MCGAGFRHHEPGPLKDSIPVTSGCAENLAIGRGSIPSAIPRPPTMSRISASQLARAIENVRALSLNDKGLLCDEIFAHQPNLFASCLVQPRLGVSERKLEMLLYILMVCYQAMRESTLQWARIGEDEQERQLNRWAGTVAFSDALDPDLSAVALSGYVESHPEQPLLAFVVGELQGWLGELARQGAAEESDKFILAAAINLVECIAYGPMLDSTTGGGAAAGSATNGH